MRRTQGISLPSVLALLALTALGSLLVVRLLWQQERLLKLDAERVRNRALAEAVMDLALQDWLGTSLSPSDTRHQMGDLTQTHVFFPTTLAELDVLRQRLAGRACREGICAPTDTLTAEQALTHASLSSWLLRTAEAWSVPSTALPDAAAQAWYWVEIWADAQDLALGEPAPRFHVRVTALVQGTLPGARMAWQGLWRRDGANSAAGHWSSWHALDP